MRRKNIFKFTNKTIRTVITVALLLVFVTLSISLISHIVKKLESKKKIVLAEYVIGELSSTGEYKESDESLFTKNLIECDGLNTTIKFNHNIKYSIYFYDENEEFLLNTADMESNYTEAPVLAKYCRVLITPKDDDQVKWYEILKYSRQVKIEVNKVQKYRNLYSVSEVDKAYDSSSSLNSTTLTTGSVCSSVIDVGSYGMLRIYVKNDCQFMLHIAGNDKSIDNTYINEASESYNVLSSTDTLGNYTVYELAITNTTRYIAFTAINGAQICVFGIER